MCGIVGAVNWGQNVTNVVAVKRMSQALLHRGPDDCGLWVSDDGQASLGHQRLSVVDLSIHGHQPMLSASGQYVISYNGEIYNFAEIRDELERTGVAPTWRGKSDTEVLIAAFDAWGIKKTLCKTVGMFAIALWNRKTRILTLARDRMGEKPLYYGIVGGSFLFASELKAIRAGTSNRLQVDRNALMSYMRYGYIPAPQSIYSGIYKLLPGHYLNVSNLYGPMELQRYWDPEATVKPENQNFGVSDKELVDELHSRLSNAVKLQMVSDVPVGAFLSGGVDSSAIVSLMQVHSSRTVRTFTVGFENRSFNEAPYARAVARHLGTEHTELIVTGKDAIALVPSLPIVYDEPFADSSQIPTALIARLTRTHVTVALSGDGSDEIFAGYPRYELTAALWRAVETKPMVMRQGISWLLKVLSESQWEHLFAALPTDTRARLSGSRMHLLAKLLPCSSLGEMYTRLMTRWQPEDMLVIGEPLQATSYPGRRDDHSYIDSIRLWDLQHYLPDDLMVKVDRAAMSASLETRAPMLDHRVVEMAMSLPRNILFREGQGKWILRQMLDRYVPRTLMNRPKAGFEVPLGDWLRGPLRSWAQALLDHSRLTREGYLNADKVTRMWTQHLSGHWDRSIYLWNVLMFQAWLEAESNQP